MEEQMEFCQSFPFSLDERSTRQATKSYLRYAMRQKRAETKRALRNLLFNTDASTISFLDEDPIWKFDRTEGWDSDGSVKKRRSRFSDQHTRKSNHKKKTKDGKEFEFRSSNYSWLFESSILISLVKCPSVKKLFLVQ
ncbi:hypothetical protein ERO13_A12G079900v2 [Gossypium hirsutum]|uniref:Uncharacterized protein isoform X2 n=2 Tax=Gossypium TaxID=3633 RepID=A0A1U8LGF0_GOSHI|nr:uncharacterized protein LOC107925988 isoform X2 [Gossypium hirsutum]KAG4169604.1 hypothetical protein ERO13_A12G079900v2 [Gossypium hirsutum]